MSVCTLRSMYSVEDNEWLNRCLLERNKSVVSERSTYSQHNTPLDRCECACEGCWGEVEVVG